MNNFCNNDCLWLLLLLFCCGGCGKSCAGGCNIETIILLYLLLCCGGCSCGCKDTPNYGFGCK